MRNGSGTYNLPAGNPVTTGTIISSSWANNTLSDIATALTGSIAKDGQTTPTANLPMGNFHHTNVGDATALTQYLTASQAVNNVSQYLSSVSGADTITASGTFTPAAYSAGQVFSFIAAGSNTTAVTLNISGLGAKNLYKRTSGGLVALVAKDLISGQPYSVIYDGTQFVLEEERTYSQGADIASASTINLDTATGDYVHGTGTTDITSVILSQGEQRTVVFDSILTLTYSASLLLPSGASIITAAGDIAVFRGEASGVVRCIQYTRSNGTVLVGSAAQIQPISASVGGNALTISASQLQLSFRSSTLGSGAVTTLTYTPSNLVISSGSTLGSINAVQSDIVVIAMNIGSTIELAAVNLSGGNRLDETNLISTTAEGGAGGADSASVIYSTTARTNVAYRVIGVIKSTQATAGTWATAPSLIQGSGGQSIVSMGGMGYGQTYQNVATSLGTTYYNTSGKPTTLIVYAANGAGGTSEMFISINGGTAFRFIFAISSTGAAYGSGTVVIPAGAAYVLTSATMTIGGVNILL